LASIPAHAQLSQNLQDWMRRINSGEFNGGGRGGGRGGRGSNGQWLEGGKAYRSTEAGASGAVRIDMSTGVATPLPAEPAYKPPQLNRALTGGTPSADGKSLLFATNSHTVMIRKTASNYWVLGKSDNSWHQLGSKSAAGLMFAKFSPDGSKAAYLGDNESGQGSGT
jgi:dipeptidyl-peptidase-4